jgi:hypothetical protein
VKQVALVFCGAVLVLFARPESAETPEGALFQGLLMAAGIVMSVGGVLWWGLSHGR